MNVNRISKTTPLLTEKEGLVEAYKALAVFSFPVVALRISENF